MALFVGNVTKVKIPSKIKPPLGSEIPECPGSLLSLEGSGGLGVLGDLGDPGDPEICKVLEVWRSV